MGNCNNILHEPCKRVTREVDVIDKGRDWSNSKHSPAYHWTTMRGDWNVHRQKMMATCSIIFLLIISFKWEVTLKLFSKTEGGLKRRVGHYRWTKYLARYLSFFIRIFNRQYAYFYLFTLIFYCIFIYSIHVSNLKNVRSFYSSRGLRHAEKLSFVVPRISR